MSHFAADGQHDSSTLARTGVIHHDIDNIHKCHTQTPTYLIHTQRGGTVPNITADILQKTLDITHPKDQAQRPIIAVHFWDMFETANATGTLEAFRRHLVEKAGGKESEGKRALHKFLNLQHYPLFLVLRDPLYPQNTILANDKVIYGDTDSGRKNVNWQQYVDHLQRYETEMAVMMCDHGDFSGSKCVVSSANGGDNDEMKLTKKMRKCLERTVAWLLQHTNVEKSEMVNQNNARKLFFTVVGGPFWQLRKRALELLIERVDSTPQHAQRVQGINLGDIGSIPLHNRFKILNQCIELINGNEHLRTLPKMISGMDDPVSILECVQNGIDIFDGTYPFTVASCGMALVFPLDFSKSSNNGSESSSSGNDVLKINLRDSRYQRDLTPLMKDCKCPCCEIYTRAYVHHLLNCHEMLAEVILSSHNLHRYLEFFNTIQNHIASGTLSQFKESFLIMACPATAMEAQ